MSRFAGEIRNVKKRLDIRPNVRYSENMTTTKSRSATKVIQIRMTAPVADEFYRLAFERHGRSGQQQGERILREWIAAEQAAEATTEKAAA